MGEYTPPASEAEIRAALRRYARGGRIACPRALEVGARLGVPPARVGRVCDRAGIKIVHCQLGCFGIARKTPAQRTRSKGRVSSRPSARSRTK